HSLLDLGDCASDDLPLTSLAPDLASAAKTPNYAFIVPNLCHDGSEAPCLDGSTGGLQAADAFLAEWVPKILASPASTSDGRPGADVLRGRADQLGLALLLEDVRRPPRHARAREHRREQLRRDVREVEDHGRPELDVGREHAVGLARVQLRQRRLLERLGDLE